MKYYLSLLCALSINSLAANISFETSLGCDNPTTQKLYQEMIEQLTDQQSSWFRFIGTHKPEYALEVCKKGYHLFQTAQATHTRIPKIIHQIWVGPRPFPKRYQKWQETWQALGWDYKLWTDKDVASFSLINKKLYYAEKNYGARADILRIELLFHIGGLYIDTDFECINPSEFERLHKTYDFYCGMSPLDGKALLINNAIIASVPGHPILKAYIDSLQDIDPSIQCSLEHPENLIYRGPAHFAQSVISHAHTGYRDVILPCSYFYPLGMYQIENELSHLVAGNDPFETIKKAVLKPETLAIHWWETSWDAPEAFEG